MCAFSSTVEEPRQTLKNIRALVGDEGGGAAAAAAAAAGDLSAPPP